MMSLLKKYFLYWGNSNYYKSQNLSSGGGNELHIGLTEIEKIIDEYINSNTNIYS
jgi:hypothetical protein